MALSAFLDKSQVPGEEELVTTLGKTKPLWDTLKSHVTETYPDVKEDWKHYGKNSGWTMKLLKKKRNLFFSYPGEGNFTVVFVFGDKAVKAAEESELPEDIIEALKESPKYAEGRGLRVTVEERSDIELVKKLLNIKVDN